MSSDGTKVALINNSEIHENVIKWANTLVGYVIGNKPFFSHLKACVGRIWKSDCSLDVFSRENGFSSSSLDLNLNVIGSHLEDLGFLMEGL